MDFIRKYFQLDKYNTSIKVEFIAGLTTFISMSYILFVNPSVLGASGMNTGAVFTATALASALGTAIMGIVANYPIGEAPALGINAFLLTRFVWACTLNGKQLWLVFSLHQLSSF